MTDQNPYPGQQPASPPPPPAYPAAAPAAYPPQAPAQPGAYPPPGYAYPAYPPAARTNTMAILAIIFGFVFSVLGIVFGHIALSQIKRTGEEGRSLALTGLIVGYVFTGLIVLFWVFYILFFVIIFGTFATTTSYYS